MRGIITKAAAQYKMQEERKYNVNWKDALGNIYYEII